MEPITAAYYDFSAEALEKSIREMLDEVKTKTGASDEEISKAFACAAEKVMDVNCFLLGNPQ